MTLGTEHDDLLSDLPPLPPLGDAEEEQGMGEGTDDPIDFGDEEDPALDEDEPSLDDDLDDDRLLGTDESEEASWTEGSEAAGDTVDAGTMVDAGESEHGHTEGTEAAPHDDPGAGIDDLGEESLLTEDGGDEGFEDVGTELWRGGHEDEAPGLPPIAGDEGDDTDGSDLDVIPDLEIDAPPEPQGANHG